MNKSILLAASAILTIFLADPAVAQSSVGATGTPAGQLAEVVVTAQRRSESLQNVPIAITVLSGKSIEQAQVTKAEDLPTLVPSLKFQPAGLNGNASFSIRGVGTGTFDPAVDQSVSAVLDDVVQLLPRVTFVNTLIDIDHIEVLRGPQGTLFGKNTTAGVISVATKAPELGVLSNDAHVQYGELNEVRIYDILNLPITDTLAARFRAVYQRNDTQIYNVYLHNRPQNPSDLDINAKILWEPTSSLRLNFQGGYQNSRAGNVLFLINSNNPNNPANFTSALAAAYGITPSRENRDSDGDYNTFDNYETYGGQANIDYDFQSGLKLTSITAARWVDYRDNSETDLTPLRLLSSNSDWTRARQISQEIRLTSPTGHFLEYVAGFYYSSLVANDRQLQAGTLGVVPDDSPFVLSTSTTLPGTFLRQILNRSIAAYAEATLHPTDRLRWILGGRVTNDYSSATLGAEQAPGVCSFAILAGGPCFPNPPPANQTGNVSHTDWTGRTSVQYDLTEDAMAYMTAARGYKAPAVTTSSFFINPIRPETVQSFELGAKTRLFDKRATLNVAIYTSKYKDFQAQSLDTQVNPPQLLYTNAGSLESKGVEAEFSASPVRGLTLGAGVSYIFTRFENYFPACPSDLKGTGQCLPSGAYNATGWSLPNAPRWTADFSASYSAPVGDKLKFDGAMNVNYRSSALFQVADVGTKQDGYAIVNATLGLSSEDGKYRVGVYARNLFNKNILANISPDLFEPGLYMGSVNLQSQRTVGVEIDAKFGR